MALPQAGQSPPWPARGAGALMRAAQGGQRERMAAGGMGGSLRGGGGRLGGAWGGGRGRGWGGGVWGGSFGGRGGGGGGGGPSHTLLVASAVRIPPRERDFFPQAQALQPPGFTAP